MSSGFSGGIPDFFSGGSNRRSSNTNPNYNPIMNLNPQQQFSLPGILPDPATQIRKRSLAEFQQQNQQQFQQQIQQQNQRQALGFYLRNVKQRPNNYFQHAPPIPPLPLVANNRNANNAYSSRNSLQSSYQNRATDLSSTEAAKNIIMSHKLQELEKQLLQDEDEEETNNILETNSVVTNNEWSDTIQNLISPVSTKPISPTSSSSSSSCTSTSASNSCPKQILIEAAVSISEGKPETATETLTRLNVAANAWGTSEQRLIFHMVNALKTRVSASEKEEKEIYNYKDYDVANQMLYDISPCFKLGFMAANLAILEAASELGFQKIHVVDFDIGQGGQYVHLLHALAAAKKVGNKSSASLSITAYDFVGDEKLRIVGEGLKSLAKKIEVPFYFYLKKNSSINEINRENLDLRGDEALAVNFAFKLYKLPDESVTTENLRDELIRRVKSLAPTVMTVVEQEMNGNTAPLVARVRDACDYYGALFDSLDATVSRENAERVRIEEGLGRRMVNCIACEGKDRVERNEMFGKWRARMCMAGFSARGMSQRAAESLKSKLNSGTRGNPGFSVKEESGGICFGWMGRTLTVASAWR